MPPPRCRRSWRASSVLLDHLDRVHRALLETCAAARAAVVVELVAVPGTQLDYRVLRAGAEAAVALAAVAARQAAACLVHRLPLGQAAEYLPETRDPLLRGGLRLLPAGGVAGVPQGQVGERDNIMLWGVRGRG